MKVVCGSCGAKYSVADDKVAGKTVKIRCKKCSEVIVVHGEQNGFEEDEATRVFDYGGEAVWHAVVNGEQQGPFTPLQVGGLLMDGKIDAEAYVWKEGFDGWKALRDVPELASLIASKGEATEVAAEPESEPDLFGSKPAGGAASAGADLFAGASSKSSSAFAASDDDDGVVASKPSPRVSAQEASMTGQRNENSVLFSLSNLQALATGPAPGGSSSSGSSSSFASSASSSGSAPAASKPAGHAVGEASGLIDIRALASATSSMGASKPSGGGSANMDDLLSIGGGASPLTSGLVAPVFAPVQPKREVEEKKSSSMPMIFGGIGLVVLLVAVGFLGYKVMNPAPPQVVERIVQVPGEAPVNGAAPTGDAPTENGTGSAGSENTAATTGTTGRTTGTTGRTTGTTGTTGRTTGTTGAATTTGSASTAVAATTGRTTGTTAPTTTSAADAMRAALNMTATTAPATTEPAMTAAPAAGAAQPSRSEIAAALGGVSGAVRACGDGTSGVASVNVTFRSTGAVSGAAVTGQFAGTPVGSCIARAVRGAHVPPFSNPTFSVTYPYRL